MLMGEFVGKHTGYCWQFQRKRVNHAVVSSPTFCKDWLFSKAFCAPGMISRVLARPRCLACVTISKFVSEAIADIDVRYIFKACTSLSGAMMSVGATILGKYEFTSSMLGATATMAFTASGLTAEAAKMAEAHTPAPK